MALFGKRRDIDEERQKTNEEQSAIRQSSPRPTLEDGAIAASTANIGRRAVPMGNLTSRDVRGGNPALDAPVNAEVLHQARQTLLKYKQGKANLDNNIIENERWYKLRHWEVLRNSESMAVRPASAWLFNAIAGKHADAMDNFPSPNILPREEGDKAEAKMLSSIVPVILDEADFEATYDNVWTYKLKTGTGVYSVTWDAAKDNGIGNIAIKKADLLNLFWQPGVTDIQDSRNLFNVQVVDNDVLLERYPQLEGHLGGKTVAVTEYVYDESIDTTNQSAVIDWYYKRNVNGKDVLHYCKFVNDVVLYATENDNEPMDELETTRAMRGLYDHGMYPFVFDVLYPVEGMPTGFGYIDIGKSAQEYIDRGNQAIMENMLANTKPRFFIRDDGSVNENEFADTTKDFVHVDGNLGQDSIMPISGKPLNDIYVNVIAQKIDELKETTGNRDISNGGTSGGVTAASAIAAQQEAGARLSRNDIKASYRAYRKIVLMVIELIRQFYSLPRCFRIVGVGGANEYITYTNAGLTPQAQGMDYSVDGGYRIPLFDVEVTAQKASPYTKMAQNELALQFLQLGFFAPQMADQALACLEMMDFDRKQFVIDKITQNAMIFGMMGGMMPMQPGVAGQVPDAEQNEALGGDASNEAKHMENARKATAESTSPE